MSLGDSVLVRSKIDPVAGDFGLMVTETLTSQRALRGTAVELLPILRENPELATLLILYGAGLDDDELTVDFDPGQLRFLRVQSFLERLREDNLHDVMVGLQRSTPPRRQAYGQVAAVDLRAGTGIIRAYDAESVRFGLGSTPLSPGDAVSYSYELTQPSDMNVAQEVTVDSAIDEDEPAAKHITAWVDGDVQVGVPAALRVKIGDPLARNLLNGDIVVPASDIPPEGLNTEWTVSSIDLELHQTPEVKTLVSTEGLAGSAVCFDLFVPSDGDSGIVKLPFTAKRAGLVNIEVRISVNGELYRSLSAEVMVGGADAQSSTEIRRDVTATRADRVGRAPVMSVEKVRIDVQRDGSDALVSGRGPGWSQEPPQRVPWRASLRNMDTPIAEVRQRADEFRMRFSAYLDEIDQDDLIATLQSLAPDGNWSSPTGDVTPQALAHWEEIHGSDELKDLAAAGHALYEVVFPPDSPTRQLINELGPGARLVVNWSESSDTVPDVPWQLMYLPSVDDEIDPAGFLGLRFRITYFAYPGFGRRDTYLGAPEEVGTAYCLFWGRKEQDLVKEVHSQRTRASRVRRVFIPEDEDAIEAKKRLLDTLTGSEGVGVLYMYCHYGMLPKAERGFRFGDTNSATSDVLSMRDLYRISVDAAPLVFANACDTSGTDAFHNHPFKQYMFSHGAAAYMGTEAKVPITMASRFATAFLYLFEERLDGEAMTAGEALSQARLLFWTRYRNLGGLFYSYVNDDSLQRRPRRGTE